jgi:hypothetical protein
VRAPSKKTSLNSAAPVIWRIGRIVMPGWMQGHQQQHQPAVAHASRVAAGEHEDPVRLLGPGGPDLLAVDHPPVCGFIQPRARLHVGQVRAGVGLRIALRPVLGAGADAGQEALLLLGGAEFDQRRREQRLADVADAPRAAERARTPRGRSTCCAAAAPRAMASPGQPMPTQPPAASSCSQRLASAAS